ncbi:tetratricopeptide repeat protein [Micromonospora mangrovi]|uniref:Tetratricopeptide repeat protein n=2 Tax=Micromonospora TaxID=1873 RepID=A0AAU8HJX0_9ACTN
MVMWRRDEVPDPEVELGPDGLPTPQSVAAVERAARAGHVVSMANLGLWSYQRGEHRDGLRWLEKAWRSGNAPAGFNLGTIWARQGDTNRAEVIWQKAADLGDPDAMVGLVRLALGRGDHVRATRWVDPVLDQEEMFPVTALGVAFRDHGDERTALRAFSRAIQLGDPYAMEYTADLLDAHGRTGEAAQLRARAAAVRDAAGGDDARFR